jgi:hypothetical protein
MQLREREAHSFKIQQFFAIANENAPPEPLSNLGISDRRIGSRVLLFGAFAARLA